GRATRIGQFFGPLLGREVPIQSRGRTGKAVLRVTEGRSKERRYYFEVFWDDVPRPDTASDDGPPQEPFPKGKGKKKAPNKEPRRHRNLAAEKKAGRKCRGKRTQEDGRGPQSRGQDGRPADSGN